MSSGRGQPLLSPPPHAVSTFSHALFSKARPSLMHHLMVGMIPIIDTVLKAFSFVDHTPASQELVEPHRLWWFYVKPFWLKCWDSIRWQTLKDLTRPKGVPSYRFMYAASELYTRPQEATEPVTQWPTILPSVQKPLVRWGCAKLNSHSFEFSSLGGFSASQELTGHMSTMQKRAC